MKRKTGSTTTPRCIAAWMSSSHRTSRSSFSAESPFSAKLLIRHGQVISTLVDYLQRDDHEDRALVVNARYFAQYRLLVFLKIARSIQTHVDVGKLRVEQ